jgi:hypothetical protein
MVYLILGMSLMCYKKRDTGDTLYSHSSADAAITPLQLARLHIVPRIGSRSPDINPA